MRRLSTVTTAMLPGGRMPSVVDRSRVAGEDRTVGEATVAVLGVGAGMAASAIDGLAVFDASRADGGGELA
jgi:hypothetical protein